MPFQLLGPPQLTLLFSPPIYILVFQFLLASPKSTPTPSLLIQCRELLSIIHCTIITLLTLIVLHQHYSSSIYPTPETISTLAIPPLSQRHSSSKADPRHLESHIPLIHTKSTTANSLLALETSYLIADTIILLRISRAKAQTKSSSNPTSNGNSITPPAPRPIIKIRPLLLHHLTLLPPLLLLQAYISLHLERGILILASFLLMNVSSVLSSIRLLLREGQWRCGWRHRDAACKAAYWILYFLCRIYLFYWVLKVFGQQKQQALHVELVGWEAVSMSVSVWRVFWDLRVPCRVGTGLLWGVNCWWFLKGMKGVLWRRREKRLGTGGGTTSTNEFDDRRRAENGDVNGHSRKRRDK